MRMKRWFTAVVLSVALALGAGAAQAGTVTWALDTDAGRQNWGTVFAHFGTVTFSSSYAASGDTLTASAVGMRKILAVIPRATSSSGYTLVPALSGTGALLKLLNPTAGATNLVKITDDNDAASTGTQVYVHDDESPSEVWSETLCHLESANAGNADAAFAITSGGAVGLIVDDDAASTGADAVYVDDDATDRDCRLMVDTGGNADRDCYIPLSDGSFLKLCLDATADSAGVLLYFDDDGATTDVRLMAVLAANADMTDGLTAENLSMKTGTPGEVPAATSLSSETIQVIVVGR